jgi:phosphotransferase system  glucose/maltose/N-acetylglucosamine-specific IIC component
MMILFLMAFFSLGLLTVWFYGDINIYYNLIFISLFIIIYYYFFFSNTFLDKEVKDFIEDNKKYKEVFLIKDTKWFFYFKK